MSGSILLEERRYLEKVLIQGCWLQRCLEFGELGSLAPSACKGRLDRGSIGVWNANFLCPEEVFVKEA